MDGHAVPCAAAGAREWAREPGRERAGRRPAHTFGQTKRRRDHGIRKELSIIRVRIGVRIGRVSGTHGSLSSCGSVAGRSAPEARGHGSHHGASQRAGLRAPVNDWSLVRKSERGGGLFPRSREVFVGGAIFGLWSGKTRKRRSALVYVMRTLNKVGKDGRACSARKQGWPRELQPNSPSSIRGSRRSRPKGPHPVRLEARRKPSRRCAWCVVVKREKRKLSTGGHCLTNDRTDHTGNNRAQTRPFVRLTGRQLWA